MLVRIVDGVPKRCSITELRRDNRNVSFPRVIPDSTLAEYDCYQLRLDGPSQYDATTHTARLGEPTLGIDGTWSIQFIMEPIGE